MKSILLRSILAALLIGSFAPAARASFPVGRVLTVTILSVDRKTDHMTFKWEHTGEILTARYTKSTRFMRGTWRRYGPETLEPGVRAEVLYSTPAFGGPFVARVFLLDSALAASRQSR